MKIQKSKLTKLAYSSAAGLAMAQAVSAATNLTGTGLANNTVVPTDHGTDAAGTPNVALAWSTSPGPTDAPSADWHAYTDAGWTNPSPADGSGLYQIDNALTGHVYTIVFTPDAGFNVILNGLDLNVYNGGGAFDVAWEITGSSSGSLGAGTFAAPTDAHTSFGFGAVTGSSAETLTLDLTIGATAGTGSYLAMDNLAFDQVAVPEPSSSALAALGLGAMAMRRRR
ncbi:MAG: PEP-CTERM sorting domain-containing protein [Akkermansiaceae bacterium]